MTKADIIIVGGGTCGLYLSSELASYGFKVIVLEKKSSTDENIICAGVVSKRLFEEFDLPKDSIIDSLKRIRVISPCNNVIDYEHPYDIAYILDRKLFNKRLEAKAKAHNVEIKLQTEINKIELTKHNIEIYSKQNNKYSAKLVVLATGVSYTLNKQLGLGIPQNFLKGAQIEYDSNSIELPTLYIGNSIAPGAFAWILPVMKNKIRLGLITDKNPRPYAINLFNIINPQNKSIKNPEFKYKPIAQGIAIPSINDRIIAVGEAAGQVKTTTGGGIYFGLLASGIASKVIKKSFDCNNFSYSFLSEYETNWHKILKNNILTGYKIRKTYSKLTDSKIEDIFSIIKHDGIIKTVQKIGDFDWHIPLLCKIINKLSLFHKN